MVVLFHDLHVWAADSAFYLFPLEADDAARKWGGEEEKKERAGAREIESGCDKWEKSRWHAVFPLDWESA